MRTMSRECLRKAEYGELIILDDDCYAVIEKEGERISVWGSGRTPEEAYADARVAAEEAEDDPWSRATELVTIED